MKHLPSDRLVLIWVLLLGLTIPGAVAADDTEGPDRGTLLIAGGGGKQGAAIFRNQNPGVAKFARDKLKLKHVTVLHTHDRREADTREFVRPLKTANGVWFSGGRQWRFADSYLGTRSEKEFHRVLKRGGVIGGSSAGASIQADFLVRGDSRTNRIMIGDHQRGLGFIENCAIDQHVVKRGRQMGLVKVLTDPDGKMLRRFDREDLLGIGIDEDTAIIVRKNTFEVFGKPDAAVLIYDPRKWTAQTADARKYITLKLGARYDMKKRRVLHLVP